MTVREMLDEAVRRLKRGGILQPRLEAESLLAHALGRDAAWFVAHPETSISKTLGREFLKSVGKRARHVPFAYVVGGKWFYGRRFRVTKGILVPRPETEVLIESVLTRCQGSGVRNQGLTIVDVGAGSGAVGLTLAAELPSSKAVLYDISPEALAVARKNARALRLGLRARTVRIDILAGRLPEPEGGEAVVAANLPYLPATVWKKAAPEVRLHEPRIALVSGEDGLDHYRALFLALSRWKKPPRLLALEAEPRQFSELCRLARALMPASRIEVVKDLHGDDRVLVAES